MKTLLQAALLTLLPISASHAIDWKKYDGQEVNMICMTITWCVALEEQLDEFKELSGITVNLDLFEESAAHQKVRTELASKSGAYDIVWVQACLLYTSPSPRDRTRSRMPSSA